MSDFDDTITGTIPERPKRDPSYGQLRPLANRRPELYEEEEYTSEDYERMMELYQGSMASIDEGEIVKAKVQSIRENVVVLDIGFKSEGTIPLE
ncbi:MAG TPA: 30S ribosomal protein S1, partial [Gemmatimonadaceae bacterium]|nr:30S ribosomal protein S1 [Gemmatimonadaceae bacterium]